MVIEECFGLSTPDTYLHFHYQRMASKRHHSGVCEGAAPFIRCPDPPSAYVATDVETPLSTYVPSTFMASMQLLTQLFDANILASRPSSNFAVASPGPFSSTYRAFHVSSL